MNYIGKDTSVSLAHYGKGHLDGGHSGRYPWGSGDERYQRATGFLDRIEQLKKDGWKPTGDSIKSTFNMSINEYKREIALSNYDYKCALIARAKELSNDGVSNTDIGKKMGVNESTVRGWLSPNSTKKLDEIKSTIDVLRDSLKDQKMVDIGPGIEKELGISRDRLETASQYLITREGYHKYNNMMTQVSNKNNHTIQNILARPEVEQKDSYNLSDIGTVTKYHSSDNGKTFDKFHYPTAMDPKRMMIRYAEEGGIKQDGVIEIRRGVKDLSLGGSNYAQVRILVDGGNDKFENGHKKDYYLKGMAVYADDLPDGVDVRFNTNKHVGNP